jgi:hypothetical protein
LAFFGIRFLAGALVGAAAFVSAAAFAAGFTAFAFAAFGFAAASLFSAPRRRVVDAAGAGRRFSSARAREAAWVLVPVFLFVVCSLLGDISSIVRFL